MTKTAAVAGGCFWGEQVLGALVQDRLSTFATAREQKGPEGVQFS